MAVKDTYSNIQQNQLEGTKGQSALTQISKVALTMVAFGVGASISNTLVTRIGRAAGQALVKTAKAGTWSAGGAKLDRFMLQTQETANKISQSTITKSSPAMHDRTIMNILAQGDAYKSSAFGKFAGRMNDLEQRTLYSAESLKRFKKNPLTHRAKQGARGAQHSGQRLQARTWRYAKETAKVAPAFYALDRLVAPKEHDKGSWANPSSMGSFLVSFVPADVMFRGALPMAKSMVNKAIGPGVGNFIKSQTDSSGRDIMQRALSFMNNHRGKSIMAFGMAVRETGATVHPSNTGPMAFPERVMKAAGVFKTSYQTSRAKLSSQQEQMKGHDSQMDQATKYIDDNNIRGRNRDGVIDTLRTAPEFKSRSYSAINRILGFTGKDDPTQDRVRSAAVDFDGHHLYKGKGFVSYKGESYNISNWSIPKLFEMVVDTAKSFKAFGHTPTDIMNINSIAEYSNYHNRSFTFHEGENVNTGVKLKRRNNEDSYALFGRMFGNMDNGQDKDYYFKSIKSRKQDYDDTASVRGQAILDRKLTRDAALNPNNAGTRMLDRLSASAQHGEYVVGKGEKVHNIAGRLFLESTASTEMEQSIMYRMGINPSTGAQLRYTALPIGSANVMMTAHDKFMGGSQVTTDDGRTSHAGYGGPQFSYGQAMTRSPGASLMGKIFEKFDLGSKNGQPSMLTRVSKFFSGLRDPLDPYNYSSLNNLLNGATRNDLTRGSTEVLQTHGRMIGNMIDDLNVFSYGKLFKEDDVLENAAKLMNQIQGGSGDLVITRGTAANVEQLNAVIAKAQSSAAYLDDKNAGLRKVIDKVADIRSTDSNYTVGNKTIFDVVDKSKLGKTTVLDEYNRQILGQSLQNFNQDQLNQLATGMMGGGGMVGDLLSAGRSLRAFRASCNPQGNMKDMFRQVTGEASSTEAVANINGMLDVIGSNQETFHEMTRKAFKVWHVGNRGSMYTTPAVQGERRNLMIADKHDTYGHVVKGDIVGEDIATFNKILQGTTVESVNNVANVVGLGFSGENSNNMSTFVSNMIFKRALPAAGLLTAWRVADSVVDDSDIFQGTSMEEGLNVFVSTQFMKARLASARVLDSTGITNFAQYAEDLMPGSMSSPLAGAVRGFGAPLVGAAYGMKFGGPGGAAAGGAIGGLISLLTAGGPLAATGAYDITKSRKDLIEEFSGRKKVAYKTDRGWLLGSTPMAGTDVDGWVPSFYSRVRSQYKYSPTLYGSKFERMFGFLDGNTPEKRNYDSRPYPTEKGLFSNKPLIGNLASFGTDQMHKDELTEWANMQGAPVTGIDTSMFGGGNAMLGGDAAGWGSANSNSPFEYGSMALARDPAIENGSFQSRVNELYYRGSEFIGLRGFMGQALVEKATGSIVPYAGTTMMADSSSMTAPGNWFWDQALGDPMGLTEFMRRFYPVKQPGSEVLNPLRNTQPEWLPEKYKTGDPYRAMPLGEIRLPGGAFETVNDVELTFPGDVDVIGDDDYETTAKYLYGSQKSASEYEAERRTKQMIMQDLSGSNTMAVANATYFDAKRDLSGTADVAANGVNYKIQAVSPKEFARLSGITPGMASKLSILSQLSGGMSGAAVYVNAATGETKQFRMAPNAADITRGLQNLAAGQARAKQLVNNNDMRANMNLGNAYSRMDRLKILTDIAPGTLEQVETEKQVEALHSAGNYTNNYENKMENLNKMQFISDAPRKLYPYRFTNMGGNSSDNLSRINDIHKEYNPIERSIGAGWEKFSHMNTVVHKKMLDVNSPYEAYDRYTISGRQIKLWNNPYQHFMKPYAQKVANDASAVSNATSLGTAGLIFGGPVGMVLGAMGGTTIGAANSIGNGFNGIPGYRQHERDIDQALDTVEYHRNMTDFQATGSLESLRKAKRTMSYVNNNLDKMDINDIAKAAPHSEQEYMKSLMDTTSEVERAKILNAAPEMLKPGIQHIWNPSSMEEPAQMTERAQAYVDNIPDNWAGFLPGSKMELIKTKIYNSEGLDARDAGVGWHSQISEINRSPYLPDSWGTTVTNASSVSIQDIASDLTNMLGGSGKATVQATPNMSAQVTVNLTIIQG